MRRRLLPLVLVLAAVVCTVLTVPGLRASGGIDEREALSLNRGTETDGVRTAGDVSRAQDGYAVDGDSAGRVSVPLELPTTSERVLVRVWAYGRGEVETRVSVVTAAGDRRLLGEPESWEGRPFDITELARGGAVRLEVETSNPTSRSVLVLDQVATAVAARDARPDAPPPLVGAWAGLVAAALLALAGRLLRHWPLPVALGVAAWLLWERAADEAYVPLSTSARAIWSAVAALEPFSLATGYVSGTYGELSPLAVQLGHAATGLVGSGTASARSATVLVALLALAVLYALAHRAAGRVCAVVALAVALLADPFRDAAISGEAAPALILAGTLFLLAVHASLALTSRYAAALLGAAGAIAFLAEPTWLPGIVLAIAILGAEYGPRGERLRVVGVGLLVLVLLILPGRVSTADQSGGDMFADLSRRATFVRNVEFAGQGRGAPLQEELVTNPFGGEPVGLTEYLFDDHSPSVLVGGTLSGANDALSAAASREQSGLAGLAGWLLTLLGTVYLLIVPRLRLVVLLPLALAAPAFFFVSRQALDPFTALAPVWPGMIAGAGIVVFVGLRLWRTARDERAERPDPDPDARPDRHARSERPDAPVSVGDGR